MSHKYQSKFHPELITDEFLQSYHESTGLEYDASEDNRYFDIVCLGYFNLSVIGEVGIYVYGKDGDIPHFHIMGNSFETAIKIFEPEYIHDNIDKLDSNQITEVCYILETEVNSYAKTIWDCIVFNWNDFYDSNYNDIIPDYTKLKEEN